MRIPSTKITIFSKTDVEYSVLILDETGQPEDITGWTVFFDVKVNISDLDADALIQKTITAHGDAQNGITYVNLSTTDTNITEGGYFYEVKAKKLDGTISVYVQDQFNVRENLIDREA